MNGELAEGSSIGLGSFGAIVVNYSEMFCLYFWSEFV